MQSQRLLLDLYSTGWNDYLARNEDQIDGWC